MKKYITLLFILLVPAVLMAQKYSNADKIRISSKIDTLLHNYMQKGVLSEQPNLKRRSEKMFKEYKSLFASTRS